MPAGTPNGRTFRATGKGANHKSGSGKGDLLVTVEVMVPTELSDAAKAAIESLRESRGDTTPRDHLFEAAT